MARVACQLYEIYDAVQLALVTAGVVSDSQCFINLMPDDLKRQPPDAPIIAISFHQEDQQADTIHCELTNEDTPACGGELVLSLWFREALDMQNEDGILMRSQSNPVGLGLLTSQILPVLNNVALENADGDVIVWETLNYIGVRNRGRWRGDEQWRRFDMRFELKFSMLPEEIDETNALAWDDDGDELAYDGAGSELVWS